MSNQRLFIVCGIVLFILPLVSIIRGMGRKELKKKTRIMMVLFGILSLPITSGIVFFLWNKGISSSLFILLTLFILLIQLIIYQIGKVNYYDKQVTILQKEIEKGFQENIDEMEILSNEIGERQGDKNE